MINMLAGWQGKVQVNGTVYDSIDAFRASNKPFTDKISIILYSNRKKAVKDGDTCATKPIYRVTVKQWMLKPTDPDSTFTFMRDRNNNIPMPLRTMTGTIEKETPGMYYMKLHGDIWAEKICHCMKCGKELKNPVSQYFGIGPECGGHGYVNPFDSEDELKEAVAAYKKQLQDITWEGWVIKSAVTSLEEVESE